MMVMMIDYDDNDGNSRDDNDYHFFYHNGDFLL